MDWSYIAGLFDADGCVSPRFRASPSSIVFSLMVEIAMDSLEGEAALGNLLNETHIAWCKTLSTNPFGREIRMDIRSWDSVESFLTRIQPLVIVKKPQVEIALKACKLRKELLSKGEYLSNHREEFDTLRHELHSYAKKGRKTLRPLKSYLTEFK